MPSAREAMIALHRTLEGEALPAEVMDLPMQLVEFFTASGVPMTVDTVRAYFLGLMCDPSVTDATSVAVAAVLAHHALGGEDA